MCLFFSVTKISDPSPACERSRPFGPVFQTPAFLRQAPGDRYNLFVKQEQSASLCSAEKFPVKQKFRRGRRRGGLGFYH